MPKNRMYASMNKRACRITTSNIDHNMVKISRELFLNQILGDIVELSHYKNFSFFEFFSITFVFPMSYFQYKLNKDE